MQNAARLPASACRAGTRRLRIRGVRAKARASTAQSITADHFLFLRWTKSGRLTVRWAERGRLPAQARSECGAGAGEVNVIRGIKHAISWTWKLVEPRSFGPPARWLPRTNATPRGSRTSCVLMNEPSRSPRRASWRPSTNGAPHPSPRWAVARVDGVMRAVPIRECEPATGARKTQRPDRRPGRCDGSKRSDPRVRDHQPVPGRSCFTAGRPCCM